MAAVQTAAPLALSATEQIASVGAKAKSGNDDESSGKEGDDEDATAKCEQLAHHLPGVEEIRRTPKLDIESREVRLERTGESYQWVVYRSRGSSPEGWHDQRRLDGLHFNPPLQYLLPDKTSRYLVYTLAVPETAEDSELMMTVADDFGAKVGTFEWRDQRYTYTVSKKLPCYPEPDEK